MGSKKSIIESRYRDLIEQDLEETENIYAHFAEIDQFGQSDKEMNEVFSRKNWDVPLEQNDLKSSEELDDVTLVAKDINSKETYISNKSGDEDC